MDISPSRLLKKPTSPLLRKPTFGTSDFAVSPTDSSEYIDATAEETCPADTVPRPEQRAADEATEAVSAASLEVMDQLKALAQNVTKGNRTSSDESDASPVQSDSSKDTSEHLGTSDAGASEAAEPSISVFPRPTVINDRPKFGTRALVLGGFVLAALIGAGGSFAWQAQLKPNDVAKAAAPAPVAPAPVVAPYVGRQLEDLAQDISSLHHRMEELAAKQEQLAAAQQQLDQLAAKQQQLATKQEQVGQSISKLQALELARQRTSAPVQYRPAPVPPRTSMPPPPPAEATVPPPPPPQTAAHPVPPMPVPQR